VADASRKLVANAAPANFPSPDGWPGEHSVLYAILASIVIIAVFAPLTVARYRRVAGR
jgi:ABC-2 type transport system permease protein